MKLAKYGELFKFIEHTDRFSEPLARTLFRHVIEGMMYLQSQGIVHSDIKPENLVINRKCNLILADFGFS